MLARAWLPAAWWPVLLVTLTAYVVVIHAGNMRLVRRGGID